MNRFVFFVGIIFFTNLQVTATKMTDSIFRLQEISVSAIRLKTFGTGQKVQEFDSLTLQHFAASDVAQLLSQNTSLNITSYGTGLSQVSTRGSHSNHTAILWNNINLQDVFNGGVDLSMIPVSFVEKIDVQYGGNSCLSGSGAIGGAIHLNNNPEFGKGSKVQFNTEYGSYRNIYESVEYTYSTVKQYVTLKTFLRDSKNNYPFEKFGTMDTLSNAERRRYGVMAGLSQKTGKNSQIEVYYWYQNNDQNVMSTMLTKSTGNMKNENNRSSVVWKGKSGRLTYSLRTSYNHQKMIYDHIDNFTSQQSINEGFINFQPFSKLVFSTNINYMFETASSTSFTKSPVRHRESMIHSMKYIEPKWFEVSTNIRMERIDNKYTPLLYAAGLDLNVFPILVLKGAVSKNYRVPTFNDLYWPVGGNLQLKNETGISSELGMVVSSTHSKPLAQLEITGFDNRVSNWIQWLPQLKGYWIPENIGKVWARGVENVLKLNVGAGDFSSYLSAAYTFTRSTKENKSSINDNTYQKQLIYTPRHKVNGAVQLSYKKYSIRYDHIYNGLRFTVSDNSTFVHSYQLANLTLNRRILYKKYSCVVAFTVKNIWNANYQVMQYYPEPFRNYLFNIQFNIN